MAKQQARRDLGISPYIMSGPGPFLCALIERQWRFLLEEVAARNHSEFQIPVQRAGPQTTPFELFISRSRPGDEAHPRAGFSIQCQQLALAQLPNRERNIRFVIDDVPCQGAIYIDPFLPFIGPKLHHLVTAARVLLLVTPLADRYGSA